MINKFIVKSFSPVVIFLLITSLTLAILHGFINSIYTPIFHIDGAFQTASGLFRIANGHIPGKDFFPYLGIGITYFLAPIFIASGADLSASIFTSYFMTVLCSSISAGFIGALIFKVNRTLTATIVGTLFILLLTIFPDMLWESAALHSAPGNSLRPLRSFIPYLSAILVYLAIRSRLNPTLVCSLIGMISGGAILWSNDYGIPTAGMTVLYGLIWSRSQKMSTLKSFSVISINASITALFLLSILTWGHAVDLMVYNFVDVRHDQWWYFGPWSANSRILSFGDLVEILLQLKMEFATLCILILITLRRPTNEYFLLLFTGISLLGGGLIATVGGHIYDYFFSFNNWSILVLLIGSISLLPTICSWVMSTHQPFTKIYWASILSKSLALILIVFSAFTVFIAYQIYTAELEKAEQSSHHVFIEELGSYLPIEWENHVTLARRAGSKNAIEEYWGLWSAVNKLTPSTPTDSLIHALGHKRQSYLNELLQMPEMAITTEITFNYFETWSISANWWFFRHLLKNYEPETTSPSTIIWRKANQAAWKDAPCVVNNGTTPHITVGNGSPGYYDVLLSYKSDLGSRSLLLIRNNIIKLGWHDDYLSINQRGENVSFPVFVAENQKNKFDLQVVSMLDDLSSIKLISCQAAQINHDNNFLKPPIFSAFDLTDENWVNGIGRNVAGFFVVNGSANHPFLLNIGDNIQFVDGQIRRVEKIDASSRFVYYYLDGEPLDGKKVGYPNEIKRIGKMDSP